MAYIQMFEDDNITVNAGGTGNTVVAVGTGAGRVLQIGNGAANTEINFGNAADTVQFAGLASTDVTVQQVGSAVVVTAGGNSYTMDLTSTGDTLTFTNGNLTVALNGSGQVELSNGTETQTLTNGGAATGVTVTPTGGGGEGETFTLTATAEVIQGTDRSDTIDGTLADSVKGDTIIDPSTTDEDVANLVITQDLLTTNAPTLVNVEQINIDFKGFNKTFDAQGVSNGTINASTTQEFNTGAIITNLSNRDVDVEVGTGIETLKIGGTSASTDATNVKLAGGNLALTTNEGGTIETVGLNSAGDAANVVSLTNAATRETFSVTGTQNLTLNTQVANLHDDTVTNGLAAEADATDPKLTVALSGLGTSTGDLKNVDADLFTMPSGAGTLNSTLTFGAGTTNLQVDVANALSASSTAATLKADGSATDDVLNLTFNKSQGLTRTDGFETVNITNATTGNIDLGTSSNFTESGSVNLFGSYDLTIGSGTNAGLVEAKAVDASAMTGSGKLNVALLDNSTNSVTVKGTANADVIDVNQISSGKGATIDAGDGNNKVNNSSSTQGATITTGSGNDSITSGSGADTINSGAGNDVLTINGGTAADHVITTDAGADTLSFATTVGTASDVFVNAGADNDSLIFGSGGTGGVDSGDTLAGGAGNDTLSVFSDAGTAATNEFDNVTGFENIDIGVSATYASDFNVTTKDSLVEAGTTLDVDVYAASSFTWDGSAETDGKFDFDIYAVGLATSSTITGGAGDDYFEFLGSTASNMGAKIYLDGNAGADTFDFTDKAGAGTAALNATSAIEIEQSSGDSLTVTSLSSGMSVSGADVVMFNDFDTNAISGGTNSYLAVDTHNTNLDTLDEVYLGLTTSGGMPNLANDTGYLIRGTYDATAKTFTQDGTVGGDTLFVYDSDSTANTKFELLVIDGAAASTNSSLTDGVLSFV